MELASKELVNQWNTDVLKALGRRLAIPKDVTRKGDLADALTRHLELHLPDLILQLTDREKTILAEAAYATGGLKPGMFSAKHGFNCHLPGSFASYDRHKETSLLQLLLYPADEKLYLYADLISSVRKLISRPPAAGMKTVSELPEVYTYSEKGWKEETTYSRPLHVYEGEKTVLAELRRVLGLVQAGKIKVTEAGKRPTDGSVKLISGSLMTPDFALELPKEETDEWTKAAGPVRAHGWGVLVQQCGWARPKGGALVLTQDGKEMLAVSSMEKFKAGVGKCLRDDDFDELNRINHIRGQTGKGKRDLTPPSLRKDAIAESMIDWPVNQWSVLEDAYRFVIASGHSLRVSDSSYYLYIGELQYGGLGNNDGDLGRQYFRAVLMESFATLGLVDVAYVYPHYLWPEMNDCWGTDDLDFMGRYDGLLYVRLTPLGAYCLGKIETYETPVPEKQTLFRLLPNHELALTAGMALSPAELAALAMFARQESDYVWKIDPGKILDFLETGGLMKEVFQFFELNSATGIPENIHVFLSDMEKKLSCVLGSQEAVLIEIQDVHTAALIAHDPQAGKVCYPAGEKHLAVAKQNLRAFKTALKKMGYIFKP